MKLKGSKCIVCLGNKKLTKHHVFPSCILNNLEINYNNKSYDIVTLCNDCHGIYEHYANDFKNQIVEEFKIPEDILYNKIVNPKNIVKVQKACHLLFYHKDVVPKNIVNQLESIIKDYYKTNEIKIYHLLRGTSLKAFHRVNNPMGKLIAKELTTQTKIEDMAQRWRNHFFLTIKELRKTKDEQQLMSNMSK